MDEFRYCLCGCGSTVSGEKMQNGVRAPIKWAPGHYSPHKARKLREAEKAARQDETLLNYRCAYCSTWHLDHVTMSEGRRAFQEHQEECRPRQARRLRGEGKSFPEIGKALGVSGQAVQQMLARNPAPEICEHEPHSLDRGTFALPGVDRAA
jgi:hypothetical protein